MNLSVVHNLVKINIKRQIEVVYTLSTIPVKNEQNGRLTRANFSPSHFVEDESVFFFKILFFHQIF